MGQIAEKLLALNSAKHAIRAAINGKIPVPLDKAAPLSVYPDAIKSITLYPKDVNFFDYDGRLVYSYTVAEFLALTELPEGPAHPGLLFQEWNWSLADAQEYVGQYGCLVVGPSYETVDGYTHLFVTMPTDNLRAIINNTGGVSVDWGDGTTDNASEHVYAEAGVYEIIPKGILGARSSQDAMDLYITEVWIGSNQNFGNTIQNYMFYNLRALRCISVPQTIIEVGQYAFNSCYSLVAFTLGRLAGTGSLGTTAFGWCTSLRVCALPKSVSRPGSSAFAYCASLYYITFPPGDGYNFPTVGASCFSECRALKKMVFTEGLERITGSVFYNCYSLEEVSLPSSIIYIGVFSNCNSYPVIICKAATPPTLGGTFVCRWIFVPAASVEAYKNATNWSAMASKILPLP